MSSRRPCDDEEPADDVVQRVRLRQLRGVDAELGGELLGDPVVEQARPGLGLDLEQLGPDDRDDPALLDEVEEVVPGVVVEPGHRLVQRKHVAHGIDPAVDSTVATSSSVIECFPLMALRRRLTHQNASRIARRGQSLEQLCAAKVRPFPGIWKYLADRPRRRQSAARESGQRRAIDDPDPLAAEVDPAAVLEAAQQARDDFAHAAELVGERLVRRTDLAALGVAIDQQRGEPLVELLVGDRLDDLHQPGQPLAEQREHVAAERFVGGDQRVEFGRRHDQQLDVGLGDARRVVVGVPEQAASRQQAGFAGLDAIELQLATVRDSAAARARSPRGPAESRRRASAR